MDFCKELMKALGISPFLILFLEILKIELAAIEIKILDSIHQVYKVIIFSTISILLLACGFLTAHVGLFLYLPWSLHVKALCLLIIGLFYIILAVTYLAWLISKRRWISRLDKTHILRKINQSKLL